MKTKWIFGLYVITLGSSSLEASTGIDNPIIPKKSVSSILVKEGQTLYLISKSNQLTLRQLYKFNDFGPQCDVLEPGTKVYLAQKKRKSTQKEFVIVDNSATLRQIANQEGIRLKSLTRMNQGYSPDEQLPKGEKVFLR
jgi:LysM repeat protein